MKLWVGPADAERDDRNQSETLMDDLSNADTLMKAAPDYYGPRFEAIAELRALDDGTLHKGNGFRRVASLVNVPLMQALKITDPEFLLNKQRFYKWLDRNPSYCTYQRPSKYARAAQIARDLAGLGKEIVMTDGVDSGPTVTNEPDNGGTQNVVIKGGTSGNREADQLARVPTRSGGNANPVEDADAQTSVNLGTTPPEIFRGTRY